LFDDAKVGEARRPFELSGVYDAAKEKPAMVGEK